MRRAAFALCVLMGCAASSPKRTDIEATSLLGKPLPAPVLSADVQKKREDELAAARARFERDPNDADAHVWLGRRTAYLGRYREAIAIFGDGIAKHPNDARFLRHRGHRFITVRRFDDAARDLEQATKLVVGQPDAIEPDGLPNAKNIPLTTLHSNIAYHLGLAHYLRGRFAEARDVFERCAKMVDNADHVVSVTYWRYLSLRRLGRHAEATALVAEIPEKLELLENHAYHRLLLLYRGVVDEKALVPAGSTDIDDATTGYGLGALQLVEGHPEEAKKVFERVVASQQWAAFGYIAAEADLAAGNHRRP